ncbi:MAG: tRNA (N6-isopentenyl adenosine(37)-C2)-methylthiotransferase MiaB, partial [Myxococcota bacterium]
TNLLLHAGYHPTVELEKAGVVIVHTCSVREKAEQKLYSELGALCSLKAERGDLVVGVGGCVAQQEGAQLVERFPGLDFVFGSQNLRHLPEMLADARGGDPSIRVDFDDEPLARFELPEQHPEYPPASPGRAFVTVMEGCDLFCAFCVVPRTRGREVSRPADAILEEIRGHAERGVVQVTLLGQTVNAYGRPRPGSVAGECSFPDLIERISEVRGIERIRFTSPHPIFVDAPLIRAYAEVEQLCPHLHLPVQSGSSRVLRAMNRRHDRDAYLRTVEALQRARPGIALTTDLIVGFPGETDEDFEETLSLVLEVGFVDSFSFKYSPRPETPAVRRGLLPVEPELAQRRLEELQALQRRLTLAHHSARVGSRTSVLIEGPSRRGGRQLKGRCPYNRVVNLSPAESLAPGSIVAVQIVEATPHSLVALPLEASGALVLPLA